MDFLVRGAAWLARHGDGAAVVPHHDADGLAAGVPLARRSGGPMLHVESPWTGRSRWRARRSSPDWGVRPVAGPSEVLYVDHHADSAPVRVHPLVAAAWSRWLAPRVVIAANDGWRRGKVSFAVRCAADRDLRAWLLARWTPPLGSGDYARGHRRATGGSLAPEAFKLFSTAVLPSGAT